jgi:CubicO group peptidase (beta-lactamase class C family)
LLRIALEKSRKQPINDLMINTILTPLAMAPIGVVVPEKYQCHYARCYDKKGNDTTHWPHPFLIGSAAVRASTPDMLKFLKAAIGTADIPAPLLKAMRMTQTPYISMQHNKHGLGWEIAEAPYYSYPHSDTYFIGTPAQIINKKKNVLKKNALFYKTGTTFGFNTYIGAIPDAQCGVVVMVTRVIHRGWDAVTNLGKEILQKTSPIISV